MGLAYILDIVSNKRARPIESMGRSSKRFRTHSRLRAMGRVGKLDLMVKLTFMFVQYS